MSGHNITKTVSKSIYKRIYEMSNRKNSSYVVKITDREIFASFMKRCCYFMRWGNNDFMYNTCMEAFDRNNCIYIKIDNRSIRIFRLDDSRTFTSQDILLKAMETTKIETI